MTAAANAEEKDAVPACRGRVATTSLMKDFKTAPRTAEGFFFLKVWRTFFLKGVAIRLSY